MPELLKALPVIGVIGRYVFLAGRGTSRTTCAWTGRGGSRCDVGYVFRGGCEG